MRGFLRAWESNDPGDIGSLFADDATMRCAPVEEPHGGHDVILEAWLSRRDQPGECQFERGPVAIDGDLAVIEGETRYRDRRVYRNLWLIRRGADGKCRSFVERCMNHANSPDSQAVKLDRARRSLSRGSVSSVVALNAMSRNAPMTRNVATAKDGNTNIAMPARIAPAAPRRSSSGAARRTRL